MYHVEERSVSTVIQYKNCAQILVLSVNKSPIALLRVMVYKGGGLFIVKIRYVTHEKNFLLHLLYFISYQQQNLSSLKIYKFIN